MHCQSDSNALNALALHAQLCIFAHASHVHTTWRMLPLMQGSVRLDNINLFSIITIMSFFILAPVTLLLEGVKFTPSAMQSMGILNSTEVIKKTLLAGVCFHAYQQVMLMLHDAHA